MKIILSFVFALFITYSYATNYYLSNSGNDNNTGASPEQAWQSLSKLNSTSLQAGDSVLFEAGSIFRGEINLQYSGTESAKIYLGKYGNGNNPVISGSEKVSGWSLYSGNIYKATFAESPDQLFANGNRMTVARYPNQDFLFSYDGINNTGIIDSALIKSDDYWKGATVKMRTTSRAWEISQVDSSESDKIFLSTPFVNPIYGGYGYYLDNLFPLLDTLNEWYCDTAAGIMYLISPMGNDPTALLIEASVNRYGIMIDNGVQYLKIENLVFDKQNEDGIYVSGNSSSIEINNCRFYAQRLHGILISGYLNNASVTNCFFHQISGQCIGGKDLHAVSITGNEMHATGSIAGYGFSLDYNGQAIFFENSDSVTVSRNMIDSTGSAAINFNGTNIIIKENVIDDALMHVNNSGALFCYGNGSQAVQIIQNIIGNIWGDVVTTPNKELKTAGIFLDNESHAFEVTGNTIYNAASCGIIINYGAQSHVISNNTVYNSGISQLRFVQGGSGNNQNHVVASNIFFAISEDQNIVELISPLSGFLPATFSSNYFFNAYDLHVSRSKVVPDNAPSIETFYDAERWKSYSGDFTFKTSFFYRNRYSLTDTLGDNLIENGNFTNNFDGWKVSNDSDAIMLLDNSTPLDGGCLKLIKKESANYSASVLTAHFPIDSGTLYLATLSNYSMRNGDTRLYLSMFDSPYSPLGLNRYLPFYEKRSDYSTIFKATKGTMKAQMEIVISETDSIFWVDNVSLYQVAAVYHEPTKLCRLFLNKGPDEITFNLGDSMFYNLDQNSVTTKLTLEPYTSQILIFDSALILSVQKNIPVNEPLKVFPNPAMASERVFIKLPDVVKQEGTISIFTPDGKLVSENRLPVFNRVMQLPLPAQLMPGIYFLQIKCGDIRHNAKMIITE